ncbi:hypothetical protein DFQ27_005375, partial [Actinomortierella ambigua]
MPPTRFKPYPDKAPKRETKEPEKQDDLSPFPKFLIDFVKRGIDASKNLLGIGTATPQEGTNNSTASQEDGGENQDAVASESATGEEKLYPDIDVDKELDAARSAMPVGTCKRRRSSADDLLNQGVYDPERVNLRKDDRLALLTAASSLPSKVEVTTLPITSPFVQRKKHILDLTKQDDQMMDLPYFATPKTDAYAYSPTPEEARGMLAIESLVRGTYLDRARQIPTAYPNQIIDYDNYEFYPPYYTVIRPATKDVKDVKDALPHKAVTQEAPSPGRAHNKESRKARAPQPRRNSRLSSGSDADESDHARGENDVLQRARHARAHRSPASPLKKRSSVSEMQLEPPRASRAAVTNRTTPSTPKKPRPTLPGRYSALDTDEEEEEIARILKEREQVTVRQLPSAVVTPEARRAQQLNDEEEQHQRRVQAIRQQLLKLNHPDRVSLSAMAEDFPNSAEASIE